jgi:hypothetical protein
MVASSAEKQGPIAKIKANFRSPKWWLLMGAAAVALVAIRAFLSSSDTLGLELVTFNDTTGSLLKITNVSNSSIKLLDVKVNDGGACSAFNFRDWKGTPMALGMQYSFGSTCRILKATVQTDKGTASYSFR